MMTVSKNGKRVPKYVGDKVELYEFEKRSIVEKGLGNSSKEGIKKKGANDNIIKPNTGYKSKVVVESSVLDKYFGGKIKLTDHEGRSWNGHTNELHVGLSEKKLKERIANDPSKKIVTSYPNEKVAESVIGEVIMKNEKKIEKWLKNADLEGLTISKTFDKPVGYGIKKGSDKVEYFNQAIVRLVKDANGKPKILVSYVQ